MKVSPDLAPSDFRLFSHLKKFLAGQQFASDDEIKVNVQNWFRSQADEFYEAVQRVFFSSENSPAEVSPEPSQHALLQFHWLTVQSEG
uniref:Histone-lysine N-methyltransferase SETMAR n=2 Tax=Araneus ventricosus TaxID=182803 RepID=A0A4Y2I6S0_ARAVE|nr:hypothetical protein AVEN_247411-1 [Araneus ventricosus]